ncbi:hypothetical protein [Leptospira sp. 'Mane']|uniref:hypothetical protein n=1 Tax=Leptospira sp. 'Mane' TaxID=3387407 RepID=UPI00398B39B3
MNIKNNALSFSKILSFAGIFLSACVSQPTYSQDLNPGSIYYYDGNQKIELELQDGLLAEFGAPPEYRDAKSKSGIRSLDGNANLVKGKGMVNIWKTGADGGAVGASKTLNRSRSITYSPVFMHSKGSGLLALPGNIIVDFSTSMTDKQVENFLASKGLRSLKKIEILNHNFYEVETPAGVSALNIANSLVGQSGVVSSSPNWWREAAAK